MVPSAENNIPEVRVCHKPSVRAQTGEYPKAMTSERMPESLRRNLAENADIRKAAGPAQDKSALRGTKSEKKDKTDTQRSATSEDHRLCRRT